jgi:hypothetical protein
MVMVVFRSLDSYTRKEWTFERERSCFEDHNQIYSNLLQPVGCWNGTWSLIVLFDGIAVAAIVMIMGMVSPKRLEEIMQRCKA